jgi:putative molybdopterin biosynthesis protein
MKFENKDFLTVKEVSGLLHINEKKVYSLVQAGRIPGTKVTGKWLFPKEELQDYLKNKAKKALARFSTEFARDKNVILLSGSDDPIISVIQGIFHSQHPDIALYSSSVGSGEGLRLLKDGFCHIALSHLYNSETDDYTFPFIRNLFDNPDEVVAMNLFYRNIGFISKGRKIRSFRDIIEGNLRFINRQVKSGIRNRVDRLISQEGLDTQKIAGYEKEVYTHFDVAYHVFSGQADAGIGTEAIAHQTSLSFHRLFEERFDMVTYKDTFFNRQIQAFVEFVRSDVFLNILKNMNGYDFRDTGRVLFPKN